MTKKEFREIVELIVSNYPRFLDKKSDFDNPQVRLQTFHDMLIDCDYERTKTLVLKHIATNPYEPKISEIRPFKVELDLVSDKMKELYE